MVAGISETPIENLGSLRACPLPSCPISAASYDLCRFCREHAELFDNPVGRVVGCPVALVGGVTEPSGDPHKIANLGLLIDIFPLAVAENDDAVPVAILDPLVAFCAAAIVRANRDVRDLRSEEHTSELQSLMRI